MTLQLATAPTAACRIFRYVLPIGSQYNIVAAVVFVFLFQYIFFVRLELLGFLFFFFAVQIPFVAALSNTAIFAIIQKMVFLFFFYFFNIVLHANLWLVGTFKSK